VTAILTPPSSLFSVEATSALPRVAQVWPNEIHGIPGLARWPLIVLLATSLGTGREEVGSVLPVASGSVNSWIASCVAGLRPPWCCEVQAALFVFDLGAGSDERFARRLFPVRGSVFSDGWHGCPWFRSFLRINPSLPSSSSASKITPARRTLAASKKLSVAMPSEASPKPIFCPC